MTKEEFDKLRVNDTVKAPCGFGAIGEYAVDNVYGDNAILKIPVIIGPDGQIAAWRQQAINYKYIELVKADKPESTKLTKCSCSIAALMRFGCECKGV